MRYILLLITLFFTITANAQDYLISFSGTGASATVSSVKVENLSSGASLTLNGSDVLRLSVTTGVNSSAINQLSYLNIYPNPLTDDATIKVYPPIPGIASATIYDLTGRIVAQIQCYLENSPQAFKVSGLGKGFYHITIRGSSYQYSGKILCNGVGKGNKSISIQRISSQLTSDEKPVHADHKGIQATVDMPYSSGQRLKFTGISGNFSTVKTDIPAQSKTISFNFIACKDGDNINYSVVEIGTQIWMAENLKTTRLNDGTGIHFVTDNTIWSNLSAPGYCWYLNNKTIYENPYGAYYNWLTVNTSKLCPHGWHVPTYDDLTALTNYLGGAIVSANKLKETGTSHWISTNSGVTNETGFSLIPGGNRGSDGNFYGISIGGDLWSSTEAGEVNAWDYGASHLESTLFIGQYNKIRGRPVRCLMNPEPDFLPVLTTNRVIDKTLTTAIGGGNISSDGGMPVTSRGICWGTSPSPTTLDPKTIEGNGTGSFTSTMTGLTYGIIYYVRAYATNNTGTAYGNAISFTLAPEIGDNYGGGKIAYILQPGDPGYLAGELHGLIAAPSDQIPGKWGCSGTTLSGADGIVLGTGNQNTIDIINGCSIAGIAARICYDLELNGYSDWYLPSQDELYKLYIGKDEIGGFAEAWYWSSTESTAIYSTILAVHLNFSFDGLSVEGNKDFPYQVRAVRSF